MRAMIAIVKVELCDCQSDYKKRLAVRQYDAYELADTLVQPSDLSLLTTNVVLF